MKKTKLGMRENRKRWVSMIGVALIAFSGCAESDSTGEEAANTADTSISEAQSSSASGTSTPVATSEADADAYTTTSDSSSSGSSSSATTVSGVTGSTESGLYNYFTESQALDGEYVKSDKYGDGNYSGYDINCPDDYWVTSVEIEYSNWALTNPDITWMQLNCTDSDGYTATVEAGKKVYGTTITRSCGSTDYYGSSYTYGDFVTGMNVIHDNYVKDLRLECGTSVVESDITTETGYSIELVNKTYETGYFYNNHQADDTDQNIECNYLNKVMTGARVYYRYDSN
ncbi:MAG: hypothetical protein AAB425_00725, partial [Bdellovibrionota bacterium]